MPLGLGPTTYIYQKYEGFMQWMASSEILQSKWTDIEEGRLAHTRLSSIEWWEGLKYIIDTVQPVYKLLRFTDQDKRPNLCDELEYFFGRNVLTWNEYHKILDSMTGEVYHRMFVGAGKMVHLFSSNIGLMLILSDSYFAFPALNPRLAYTMDPTPEMFRSIRETFECMMDVQSAMQALHEGQVFR
jgi:hypothetical protein